MKKKYTWFGCGDKPEEMEYTVIHREGKVETLIATTDTAEKADFICKACNQFNLEQYEKENKK